MNNDFCSLPHLEELARDLLPEMAFEFVASGAADEHTLRWNEESYAKLRLRPRVLRDVSVLDTRVSLLGEEMSHPIMLAPTSYQRVLHPEGELATARAASETNITWVVSSSTNTTIEDIARVATAPLWFQLYIQSDRDFTREQVERAQAAGCKALCLTVDTPTIGIRDRQTRAKFELPPDVQTPHLFDIGSRKQRILDPRRTVVTWKDIEWLRSIMRVPLVLKGILDPDDAELAIDNGANAVIVSNHGARNLDTAPATIDALPSIAERVGGRIPVLVDGGVRRGTDVLKAVALGASAVLIGRPYCYGLAVGGSDGVRRVVEILRRELEMAMMLCGRAALKDLDRGVIWDK